MGYYSQGSAGLNAANNVAQQYALNNLDFWSDFGKGFQMGFGGVMDGFSQIAKPLSFIPGVGEVLMPTAAIGNAANHLVQNAWLMNLNDEELAQLDFWSDFGKGFQMGFGGVMDGFSQIAKPLSFIPGVGEVLMPTAAIGNAANQLVQNAWLMNLDAQLMQLNLNSCHE